MKQDITDNTSQSLSADTRYFFEQWQQHFSADADRTLNELMRLASFALSSPSTQGSQNSIRQSLSTTFEPSYSSNSVAPPSSTLEPSPWLAISRLTDTVAHLTSRVLEQNERLMNLRLSSTPHFSPNSPSQPSVLSKTQTKTKTRPPTTTSTSDSAPTSSVSPAAALSALKSMTSAELRASRARCVPIEKLNRALEALIHYNQQQSSPQHRWRINTSILQQLTGCFNSYVKDFVRQHQSEIDEHNQQFG